MFNPNASAPALAACTYVIDEITLPTFLPGAVFTDVSLSLEVWNGEVYIDEICFSEESDYKIFKKGDWLFDNFTKALYAKRNWNEYLIEACREAA